MVILALNGAEMRIRTATGITATAAGGGNWASTLERSKDGSAGVRPLKA